MLLPVQRAHKAPAKREGKDEARDRAIPGSATPTAASPSRLPAGVRLRPCRLVCGTRKTRGTRSDAARKHSLPADGPSSPSLTWAARPPGRPCFGLPRRGPPRRSAAACKTPPKDARTRASNTGPETSCRFGPALRAQLARGAELPRARFPLRFAPRKQRNDRA